MMTCDVSHVAMFYNKLWVQGNFPLNIEIGDVEEKQLDLSLQIQSFSFRCRKWTGLVIDEISGGQMEMHIQRFQES